MWAQLYPDLVVVEVYDAAVVWVGLVQHDGLCWVIAVKYAGKYSPNNEVRTVE